LVRKSGIIDDRRLVAYLEKDRTSSLQIQPKELAERLVRDGLLTHFQAEQFLQGKWRRFTIGNYKVLERIGAGGMGSVFLCEHKFMRRRAAVKILPASQSNDPSALERFYREARAVAALDHPNIVRAYDIDQDDNLHFLVMEYVDGSSLQELVQRAGPLSPLRSAHYISQAALGLQHAHEAAALVHRDVKPGNIIVDRCGTVKVLDLGLARFFHDEEDLLTKKFDENVLGTADYLAPEQALDSHSVDIRGDIYSLGGTLYFCLTGLSPFAEGTVAQKLIWHQTRQPKPIRSIREDVPEEMVAVINKMMAKDPQQRYQTPLEVVQALEPWTRHSIPPPAEAEMPRLSPAARGRIRGDANSSLTTPSPSCPASSRTRKIWQVPVSPTPQPNVGSLAAPPASPAKPAAVLGAGQVKAVEGGPNVKPIVGAAPTAAQKAEPTASPIVPAELELVEPLDSVESVQPSPATAPIDKEDSLPCVELALDTEDLKAKANTEPHAPKKVAAHRPRRSKVSVHSKHQGGKHRWWLGGIVGGVLCVLVAVLGWRLSAGRTHKEVDPAPARPPLVVSRSADHAFRTVREALRVAEDKDRIEVRDDIEERLELISSKKELVLEPEPGRIVSWRFPGSEASGIVLNGVGNLRIRGFTFDGRNLVDQIMLITGHCPGLTLEDIQLRGFRRCGILIANGAGRSSDPVTLVRVHAPTKERKEAAIAFITNPSIDGPRINEHFVIKESKFDGPYATPVRLSDPSAIRDVVFSQNTPTNLVQVAK
jgi:serine/threonine protein kinase